MHEDQLLPAEPGIRAIARELYRHAKDLPLISPHGHVDPAILADDRPFPDPARLIVVPDHYVTRMLASQGIAPHRLGVPSLDGTPVEQDGRTIWRLLAANWHLFRGTPSRLWTERVFTDVFGVDVPLRPDTADAVYDALCERLEDPGFRPRALFERFNLEMLATTESPLSDLTAHAKLEADGWGGPGGRVITTFRPDDLVDFEWPGWAARVEQLGAATFPEFLDRLRQRRQAFIAAGATSSDHGHPTAATLALPPEEAAALFDRALRGGAGAADAERFRAHMLVEFARMSVEDGLVMQLHPGAVRNHNATLYARYGRDVGGDIPSPTEYVRSLRPLLDAFGTDPRFRIVLYTLDETTFTRELAPLAGGYPAVFLGAPWWFLDSPEGLRRFRETVTETAGFANTSGFVDDTRAFCSIPVRHDVARRIDAGFLARLVAEHRLPLDEAAETIADLAYHLPKRVFERTNRKWSIAVTVISGLTVHDVRFPTAAAGDGSDAINRGDYSATYVELTCDEGVTGTGLTFTNGRGNELTCAAVEALRHHVVGHDVAELCTFEGARTLTADVQLRWLGPEKGVIHMAAGAILNAVWDLRARLAGVPMWRLLAELPTAELVAAIDFRHISDALNPAEAAKILDEGLLGYAERLERAGSEGFPSYTTSVGWLGYPDEKVRALTRQAVKDGWTAVKMKVGGPIDDDVRRAGIIREEIGPDALLMMDANQIWDVDEAIANMARLVEFAPYWIEEPTHADDVLGHARIQQTLAGRCRVATGEVGANRVIFKQLLQAGAIGVMQVDACRVAGVGEVLAELLMAAKFGVPVCPHAGGVGLCEYVQHLSFFDYLRVGRSLDGRMVEYVDHLHEHFTDPVRVVDGRYRLPERAGYSVELRPSSIAMYTFPTGPAWSA